jgi:hypothetical protein
MLYRFQRILQLLAQDVELSDPPGQICLSACRLRSQPSGLLPPPGKCKSASLAQASDEALAAFARGLDARNSP